MGKKDQRLERLALRLMGWIVVSTAVLFGIELAIDLMASGRTLTDLTTSPESYKALASTVSRAINNLMAMVLAFIALAIPITANMYTPKLIDIFVHDRINMATLLFFAVFGAHAIFGQALIYDDGAPTLQYFVLVISGILGFIVLIPYYLYVLSFLDPETIIRRVSDRITNEFPKLTEGARLPNVQQRMRTLRQRLRLRIQNLGNVILRAVDRSDRDVALSSIRALREVVHKYDAVKPKVPDQFFELDPDMFVGLSIEAKQLLVTDKIWVEQKCLSQLQLAFESAVTRMPDAISAISDICREVTLNAARTNDTPVVRLGIRYFNTYLRVALRRTDIHAIYDVFNQYRLLAEGLLPTHPQLVDEIGGHFKYYAEFARYEKLAFLYELGAAELAKVTECAYAAESVVGDALLERFLTLDTEGTTVRMAVCRAVLAGYFEEAGLAAERDRALEAVACAPAAHIQATLERVRDTVDSIFWEVTDRQTNLDYVEPERRAVVVGLLQGLLDNAKA